jgi:hypothetical protein
VEPIFNEMVRKLQGEKAWRLCTARRASVYSDPINQSKTEGKILKLILANLRRPAVPMSRVLI